MFPPPLGDAAALSFPYVLLLMLARWTSRTNASTTSDIGGLNSGSVCHKIDKGSLLIIQNFNTRLVRVIIWNEIESSSQKYVITWTQSAITSANRERDLTGYSPWSSGSTILVNALMSWSWGVAHRTKDCSVLGLELNDNKIEMEVW